MTPDPAQNARPYAPDPEHILEVGERGPLPLLDDAQGHGRPDARQPLQFAGCGGVGVDGGSGWPGLPRRWLCRAAGVLEGGHIDLRRIEQQWLRPLDPPRRRREEQQSEDDAQGAPVISAQSHAHPAAAGCSPVAPGGSQPPLHKGATNTAPGGSALPLRAGGTNTAPDGSQPPLYMRAVSTRPTWPRPSGAVFSTTSS
jgi:hypothetical protein